MLKQVAALAALMSFTVARADDTAGAYLGLGVGRNTLEVEDLKANDTAFKVFGGYRFNQYVSAELAYIDGGSPSDQGVTADATAFQGALLAGAPVGQNGFLFAKAGLLKWDAETKIQGFPGTFDDDGTDFSYGAGGALQIGRNAALRLEYELAKLEDTDLNLLSLSFTFSFKGR